MTDKQHKYIISLAKKRDLSTLSEKQIDCVARCIARTLEPTPAQASRIIKGMLLLPFRDPQANMTWREARNEVAETRSERTTNTKLEELRQNCSQKDELPGSLWEDIFA